MLDGYYRQRWESFLQGVGESLDSGRPFDQEAFHRQLRRWMTRWSEDRKKHRTDREGDSIEVARRLWQRYGKDLSAAADKSTE